MDEAHSSQTGEASEKLKQVLADTSTAGKDSEEDLLERYAAAEAQVEAEQLEIDEQIAEELRTQGFQENLSFFAFTATPSKRHLKSSVPQYLMLPRVHSMSIRCAKRLKRALFLTC